MRGDRHALWWAAIVHRLSGVALALFLPAHFWALGLAIEGEARLGGFLRWAEHPLAKVGEAALVVLLAAHLAGGLRVMALEMFDWSSGQRTAAALSAGASLAVGLVFLLNAF